jgi:hypothetical protein
MSEISVLKRINPDRGGYRPKAVVALVREAVREEREKSKPARPAEVLTIVLDAVQAEMNKINPNRGGYRPQEVADILAAVQRNLLNKLGNL